MVGRKKIDLFNWTLRICIKVKTSWSLNNSRFQQECPIANDGLMPLPISSGIFSLFRQRAFPRSTALYERDDPRSQRRGFKFKWKSPDTVAVRRRSSPLFPTATRNASNFRKSRKCPANPFSTSARTIAGSFVKSGLEDEAFAFFPKVDLFY